MSFVLALVFLMAILPGNVFAAEVISSGTCGNGISWELDDEGTLTVIGSGTIRAYGLQGLGMKKAILPATVSGIDIAAFVDNYELEEIIVEGDGECFCSVDGVLFTADRETLVCYHGGKQDENYTVPSTVKTIV